MAFNFNANTKSYSYIPKDNPKDRVEVEIGDSMDSSKFFPQVKIKRWDNEVNLSYRLNYANIPGNISYSSDGNTITWKKGQYEAHFYHINDGEGAFEFDITIPKKPPINYLEFTLQDKDVEYFYQPPLTQEEIDQGASQPENVIGSYAIYAATPKTNWTGGTEYKCGKVGHIFRPKIIDSAGTEVWGDLHIENGILSVTIPQDFLDKAVYPVRHAAGLTFGYTTAGSSMGMLFGHQMAYRFTGASGTATSITAHMNSYTTGGKYRFALYLFSDNSLKGSSAEASAGYTAWDWRTQNLSSSTAISAVDYALMATGDGNTDSIHYDSGASNYSASTTPYSVPDPFAGTFNSTNKYSIYATYTAGGGGAVATPRGFMTTKTGFWG